MIKKKDALEIESSELDLDRKKFWFSLKQTHDLGPGEYQAHEGEIWAGAHVCDEPDLPDLMEKLSNLGPKQN